MEKTSKREILISVVLSLFVLALINPFHILMSSMLHMCILGILVAMVGVFAGLVLNEKVADERERDHKDKAGRVGYTAGLLVVTLGIIVQTFKEMNDPWLLIVLLVMVVSKIVARVFFRKYR